MDFVSATSPAAVAGFQKGDLIDHVGTFDIKAESGQMKLSRVITTIRQSAGKPLAITVLRGVPLETKASAKGYAGKTTTQSNAKPSATSSPQAQGTPVTITVTPNANGQIGVQLKPEGAGVERITNPIKASVASVTFLWDYVVKNFEGIGWLLTGKIAPTELSGPVRIIEEGGRMIEESGFQNGLILTAIISVILAVMNLLPIPALDGGHILFLLIEAIKGSPVKKSIQDGCVQGGFVVLMLFMGVVLVNDVLHLFK
jgi:RIP metalloprotease RseP